MKKMLSLLCCLLFFSNVFAGSFKDVVIFGDSLSDDGNLYSILRILPKSPPYYEGRFTNGRTWAEYVGNYYYDNGFASYTNYAYGGATAILHQLRNDHFIAPVILQEEIDSYLLHHKDKDKSQTLFALWISANDYLYDDSPDIDALTTQVVDKIVESLTTLIQHGGKHFVVLNLPDLSLIPFATNNDKVVRLGNLSLLHNNKLALAIQNLQAAYPTVKFSTVDIYSIFVDLIHHPDKYNEKYGKHVTNVTNSCWLGDVLGRESTTNLGTREILGKTVNADTLVASFKRYHPTTTLEPCEKPNEFLFWDDMHPTAVVHEVLGSMVVDTVDQSFR